MKLLHRGAAAPPRWVGVRWDRLAIALAATLMLATAAGSTASATSHTASGNADQDSADQGQDSPDGFDSESPWTCDEGDEPRILTPDVTAPSLPFRGVVYADWMRDRDSDAETLVVRYHSTVSRTNTEIIVAGLRWNSPLSIDRISGGLLIGEWALSVADSCTLRRADAASSRDRRQTWASGFADVVIPWGRPARLEADSGRTRHSDAAMDALAAIDSVSDGLESENFRLGRHANGIHVVAGDQVGAYVRPSYADSEDSTSAVLYGDYRLWGPGVSVNLLGTDGELLAFAVHDLEPAWAPEVITVMSMRTGEVVACGHGAFGTFLLFSPAGEGLVVPEIKLHPSGLLDAAWGWGRGEPGADCPRGIDASFFEYLASQPVPQTASAAATLRPIELPSTSAPQDPFGGIVRAFSRYNPESYEHDHVVQYYDSDSGDVTEIVFDGERGPRLGAPRLADDGVLFYGDSRTSVLIPWGSPPELVAAERLSRSVPAPRQRRLALSDTAADAGALPCTSAPLDVNGSEARARWVVAKPVQDHDGWWRGRGLLELMVGDVRGRYLLDWPANERADVIEVQSKCDHSWFLGEFESTSDIYGYFPRLIGSDGAVLMVSWVHVWGDDFYGEPDDYLTYLISLRTGEVLACGLEPRTTDVLFVQQEAETLASLPPRLPPSGWLDSRACVDGDPNTRPQECTSIFWRRSEDLVCARELDFRTIGDSRPGISPTPATIDVRVAGTDQR